MVKLELLEMQRSWSASRKQALVFLASIVKIMKFFSKDRRHAVLDSNRLPLKYKADSRPFLLARLST
jgi:hypothetical protein